MALIPQVFRPFEKAPKGIVIAVRFLNLIALLIASWCVMTFIHESGHILCGYACGGKLRSADLAPWRLPYSIFEPAPFPLVTLWGGPILGATIPLLIALATRKDWSWFIAYFCVLANGFYIATAWLTGERLLDTRKLLEHGEPDIDPTLLRSDDRSRVHRISPTVCEGTRTSGADQPRVILPSFQGSALERTVFEALPREQVSFDLNWSNECTCREGEAPSELLPAATQRSQASESTQSQAVMSSVNEQTDFASSVAPLSPLRSCTSRLSQRESWVLMLKAC